MTGDCGTCNPPPEDSADREAIERFASFLQILDKCERDDQGRYVVGRRALAYAMGEDVDPRPDGEQP